jgi:hypothetical protein
MTQSNSWAGEKVPKNINEAVRFAFEYWCTEWLLKDFEDGGFGYRSLAAKGEDKQSAGGNNAISSFIGTEADIQMHFGAFLFQFLAKHFRNENKLKYSVHSEMKIYAAKRKRADLVVCKIDSEWRLEPRNIFENAVAIIEIKNQALYNPYRPADYKDMVCRDIAKTRDLRASVPTEIERFMLLLDENVALSAGRNFEFADFIEVSGLEKVTLLVPAEAKFEREKSGEEPS